MPKWHDNSGNLLSVILRYILKPIFLHVHCIDFNGSIIKASHCMSVQRFANFLLVLFCVPRVLWRMKEKTTQQTFQKATFVASRSTEDIYVTHFAFNNGNIGAMVGIAQRMRTRHSHCVCISCFRYFCRISFSAVFIILHFFHAGTFPDVSFVFIANEHKLCKWKLA